MQRPYGFALIINNDDFEGQTEEGFFLNTRRGSDIDLANLEDLWRELGFIVQKHINLNARQIYKVVNDMANNLNMRYSSCFVCFVMTHGAMGKIYGSDSKHLEIKCIIDLFTEVNCPGLAGKPKLFFFEACRGRKMLTGRYDSQLPNTEPQLITAFAHSIKSETLQTDAQPVADENNDDQAIGRAFFHNADPNEPHFLLGYSTAPGRKALLIR